MPVVTSDMTDALRTNIVAIFNQGLLDLQAEAPFNLWQKIATRIPSDTDQNEYNWLGATPPMNEWKDQRQLRGLRPFSYTVINKDWEATLEIDRNALADNKLGQIPKRVRGLSRAYLKRIIEEVFTKLDDGASDTATFDSTAFFANTRTIGASANIDNSLSGSYSASSAEIRAAIQAGMVAMMAFQDDWGKPLGLMPDTIVCSPSMYVPIREALKADVAGQVRTETEFVKNLIASPWIDADVLDWYLLCTTEEIKPIIFQDRQAPEVASLDRPTDRDVFMQRTIYYGIDARFVVCFGDPRTAIKIVDA